MKKTVKCSIFLIFVAMFVLASFSPSVDGRAVVANRGELPEGLFAKSVGYLPGDTLSVTNMVTRQSASVLVVGALDASEGVAILLSPEAANILGIAKNSNIVVKITKRSDELDKAFVGNAFVAKDDVSDSFDDYSENRNIVAPPPVAAVEPAVEHTYVPVTTPSPVTPIEPVASVPAPVPVTTPVPTNNFTGASAVETLPREVQEVAKVPPSSNKVSQSPKTEDKLPMDSVVVLEEKNIRPPVSENLPDEKVAEQIAEKIPAPAPIIKTEEKLPVVAVSESIPAPYDDVPSEYVAITEELPKDDVQKDKFVAETIPSWTEEDLPAKNTVPIHDTLPPAYEEPVKSYVADNSSVVKESPVTGSDTYAPIVLVPAEMNPPEAVESNPVKNISETVKPSNLIASLPPASGSGFEKYIVNDLSSLKSGSYYVQVATMADKSNMNNMVKDYGNNYPLVFVPSSNGKMMQVMVGPLSVDEYEVVMTRFKSFGFNDSFLRKIK